MTRLYLIRHGRVEWNIDNSAYVGWTDLPLDEVGEKQAQNLAYKLRDIEFSAIYSSDRIRSIKTAEAIASNRDMNVVVAPNLRELNYGEWEGISTSTVKEHYSDLYNRWLDDAENIKIPGGESLSELKDRVSIAVNEIIVKHPDQSIAVVAHKSVNRMLICHWLDMEISRYREIGQDNAALNIMRIVGNRVSIETVNDVCHV